jgi:HSP20 family protein
MKLVSFFPTVGRTTFPAPFFDAFDELLDGSVPSLFRGGNADPGRPAVNIAENDDAFTVEVAAPGLAKKNFEVKVANEMLVISASHESKKEEKGKYTRREFSFMGFERSFVLPDFVDAGAISANYENGILTVALPKKAEAKLLPARTIEIS